MQNVSLLSNACQTLHGQRGINLTLWVNLPLIWLPDQQMGSILRAEIIILGA